MYAAPALELKAVFGICRRNLAVGKTDIDWNQVPQPHLQKLSHTKSAAELGN
jgi:hypothetical protein